jgi:hypothetical protein
MMMNLKVFGRKRSWPNFKVDYYRGICLEELRKTTKHLNQQSQSSGPTFEPGTYRLRNRSVNRWTATFGVNE